MNNLTLFGLTFNFIGSCILVINTFIKFGKPNSAIFTPSNYGKDGRPRKFTRGKQIYDSRGMPAGYKKIKITKEEIMFLISLILIIVGFILQILGYSHK